MKEPASSKICQETLLELKCKEGGKNGQELSDNYKKCNIYVMGMLGEERREQKNIK